MSVPRSSASTAPNKKDRRAGEQTERREQLRSVARSEAPANADETPEEGAEDNKLAASTPSEKQIVGLNGQLALNMMSKNKKK